ncbi:MAG: hypothetical protein C4523_01800 [Myxococcales bacterium]|nr:MAG: hypothetical protein C4523_01800 [Myxococcales bacterium]
MKKTLVLLAVALVAVFAYACGDDGAGGCGDYCDKALECDESGVLTAEWADACKTACDAAADQGVEIATEDQIACAEKDSCEEFNSCVVGGGDGDTDEDGDE